MIRNLGLCLAADPSFPWSGSGLIFGPTKDSTEETGFGHMKPDPVTTFPDLRHCILSACFLVSVRLCDWNLNISPQCNHCRLQCTVHVCIAVNVLYLHSVMCMFLHNSQNHWQLTAFTYVTLMCVLWTLILIYWAHLCMVHYSSLYCMIQLYSEQVGLCIAYIAVCTLFCTVVHCCVRMCTLWSVHWLPSLWCFFL